MYLTPVGQKLPNELGIYDMSGNVNEFCEDNYGGYASLGDMNAPLIDPLRLDEYPDYYFRMVRGGYCAGLASDCTVTTRAQYHNTISQVVACGGLRLALGGGPFFVD